MNTVSNPATFSIIECTEWTRSGKAITTYKYSFEGKPDSKPFKTYGQAVAAAQKAGA